MRAAIFRHSVSPRSEPFIASQVSHFPDQARLFSAETSGEIKVENWALERDARLGRAQRVMLQLARRAPSLEAALREYSPDVLVAHFAQDSWRIAGLAQRLQLPLVTVVHGSDALISDAAAGHLGLSARQLRNHWDDLTEATALFLPVSEFLNTALIRRGVPPEKVETHYLGVVVPDVVGISEPEYDIGFFGRLEPNKGALRLMQQLSDRVAAGSTGAAMRALVAGAGSEFSALQDLSNGSHHLRIHLAGSIDPEEVQTHMARCRVVVCPSITLASGISEGLNLTSLEAQAVGRPVVAFRTGGLPETILNEVTGLVVEEGDWSGFADEVIRLVGDKVRVDRMGRAARARIQADWDVRRKAADLVHLLQKVSM